MSPPVPLPSPCQLVGGVERNQGHTHKGYPIMQHCTFSNGGGVIHKVPHPTVPDARISVWYSPSGEVEALECLRGVRTFRAGREAWEAARKAVRLVLPR